MTRRYVDPLGIVHDVCQIRHAYGTEGVRITACEDRETSARGVLTVLWPSEDLTPIRRKFTTCLQCLAVQYLSREPYSGW